MNKKKVTLPSATQRVNWSMADLDMQYASTPGNCRMIKFSVKLLTIKKIPETKQFRKKKIISVM